MASLVLCDLCGQSCAEAIHVSSWWGKVFRKGAIPKHDGWKLVRHEDCDSVQADLCHSCLHNRLGIAQLHAEPTREQQFERYLQDAPASVRLCQGYAIKEINFMVN